MKSLKRLLLIHWHYFIHETIDFEKINFLTGVNSSGKSIIIDAIQLVLLADTSGTFFNKAASGRSNRTLGGYLRGELGDDEGSGFNHLRDGRFTSYIALEFYDESKRRTFTAGCCFDTFGENDTQKMFFRFDGAIPEHEFLDNGTPLPLDQLRTFLRTNYQGDHRYTTDVNRDFREDLHGHLGGLRTTHFNNLFKKAVSFDPDVDIRKFITEFVCGDEQQISIEEMKTNIQSYDTLRAEEARIVERLELLDRVCNSFDDYSRHLTNELLYTYLIRRAQLEILQASIEKLRQQESELSVRISSLADQLLYAESRRSQLQGERDSLKLQLDSNENAHRLEQIQSSIAEKRAQIRTYQNEYDRSVTALASTMISWRQFIDRVSHKTQDLDLDTIQPLLKERLQALKNESEALLLAFEPYDTPGTPGAQLILDAGVDAFSSLASAANSYRDNALNLLGRITDARQNVSEQLSRLNQEKQSLEQGIYQFPEDAVDLKQAILSRLRSQYSPNVQVSILAEVIEINDDRWRNTIEAYLASEKFFVVVQPEHFSTARQVYTTLRRKRPAFSAGLIDSEHLSSEAMVSSGSLAESLDASQPVARHYLDHLLGEVIKCNSEKQLQSYSVAVTDDGQLYRNFALSTFSPSLWSNPAIGQEAAKRRLIAVQKEIAALEVSILTLSALSVVLEGADLMTHLSDYQITALISNAKLYQLRPELEEDIVRLSADADSIDKSEIEVLLVRLAEREEELTTINTQIKENVELSGSLKEKRKHITDESLPNLEHEAGQAVELLAGDFESGWVGAIGDARYQREVALRSGAQEIADAFPRELSRSRNAREISWSITRDQRHEYNTRFETGYDVNAPDNDDFNRLQNELRDIRLPEYRPKVEDARIKAYQQFQEDLLSKLQSNIATARRQIEDLNRAMKSASFGEDTYQFKIRANPDYKRFHDMIVDEMLLSGGYNLLSEQYNTKYRDEITELFEIITNEGAPGSHGYSDYERRVQVFTDYKTYLQFDLEVTKPSGESERLSRTIHKKSGGETQTPFYIAVLASFVQLYRIGRDKHPNTMRLIVFDEAFSKMDGERVAQSIELLRRFDFQVILAAPPNMIPEIATLVDRNLVVLRQGRSISVHAFDPRDIESPVYALEDSPAASLSATVNVSPTSRNE